MRKQYRTNEITMSWDLTEHYGYVLERTQYIDSDGYVKREEYWIYHKDFGFKDLIYGTFKGQLFPSDEVIIESIKEYEKHIIK